MTDMREVDERVEQRLPGYVWLWFAVAGGQAAWAVAVLIAYPMVQVACETGIIWLVHSVRWIAMVVALASTAAGFTAWRRVSAVVGDDEPLATVRHVQRARFMAFAGMILSAVAFLLLFVEDIAAWMIDPCL